MFCAGCASQPSVEVEIGAPLPGRSAAELERFRQGEAIFAHVFTPEEGLGPSSTRTPATPATPTRRTVARGSSS